MWRENELPSAKIWEEDIYIGHRKFLKRNHPYRRLKKVFNGCQEDKTAPPPWTGDGVYNRVSHIEVTYGKAVKHSGVKNIWKKKLIFFELPYWSKLDVRHCIDWNLFRNPTVKSFPIALKFLLEFYHSQFVVLDGQSWDRSCNLFPENSWTLSISLVTKFLNSSLLISICWYFWAIVGDRFED